MKIRGNTVGTPMKPEKNLVRATALTEEEKALARENIGAGTKIQIVDEIPADAKDGDVFILHSDEDDVPTKDPDVILPEGTIPDAPYVTEDQMHNYVRTMISEIEPEDIGCNMTIDEQKCENVGAVLNVLANRDVGGGSSEMKLLYSTTTKEDLLEIRTGINPNDYNEILMIARAVSSDSTKSTHFVWNFYNGKESTAIVSSGLHNTQIRSFVLELKKPNSGLWRVQMHSHQNSTKPLSNGIYTGFHSAIAVNNGVAIWEDVGTELGCGAYIHGGTNLAAGAELMVWGC